MSRPPSMRASASATTRSWTRTAIRWTATWCTWRATRPSAACCAAASTWASPARSPSATRRTNWAWRCCGIAIPNSRTCRASCRPSTTASTATAKSPAALVGVKAWDPAAGVCYAASFLPSSPSSHARQPRRPAGRHRPARVLLPVLRPAGRQHPFPALVVRRARPGQRLHRPDRRHRAAAQDPVHSCRRPRRRPDRPRPCADRGGADRLAAALRLLSAGRHAGLAVRRHAAAERRLPLGAAAAGPHGDRQRARPGTILHPHPRLRLAGLRLDDGQRRLSHQDPRRELGDVAAHADDRGLPGHAAAAAPGRAARAGRRARDAGRHAHARRAARPPAAAASPPPRWCRPATASCIPIRRCTGRPRAVHRADITIVGGGRGQRGAVLLRRAQGAGASTRRG